MQQTDIVEMQKLIEKLDGVVSAKFFTDGNGDFSEIHILADRSKPPKQLSRDIQSALAASSGLNIEHKIISIAQINDELLKQSSRFKIHNVDTSSGNGRFISTVVICDDSKKYSGTAEGINNAASRYTTVSSACLNALHEYYAKNVFFVNDVLKVKIAGTEAINVAVSYINDGTEKLLTGTALIKDDEYNAIIKATLNAVNRILPKVSI